MKKWKVKILKNCKICGNEIKTYRFRTYCSSKCRNKEYNKKYYLKRKKAANERRGEYQLYKVKCLICSKWYVQVGSHIYQKHKMAAREYREEYNLPLKKGILPLWFRKIKREINLNNKTYLNLKAGKKNRFKLNDKRAIRNIGYKGQAAKIKNLLQEIYPH